METELTFPLRSSEIWKDVTPIPQDDGPNPIVPISYSPHFVEVMDYFRAILKKGEKSKRALSLTKEVIKVNPANYTGWLFRRECLLALGADLKKELKFIDEIAEVSSKNYQLWHHRRVIVKEIGNAGEELEATTKALIADPKNYHVWAHRQWVLRNFNLYKNELKFVDLLLKNDIRNNSAWNQRFFVVKNTTGFTEDMLKREIDYAYTALKKVPNNLSPWNYLRGLVEQGGHKMMTLINAEAAEILKKDSKCAECLSFLVDVALKFPDEKKLTVALSMCERLKTELSQIRAKYWEYQAKKVQQKLDELKESKK
ncbi:hypothetical protein AAMO2058_000892500 [Amorphochlora amoebiformis]